MKLRTILAVAIAATAVTPAAASAAGTITGGPVKAGGYSVVLHATDAKKDQLIITMSRGSAKAPEDETLIVTSGVRVTVGNGSATIKGSLGRRGKVDLRLQSARKDSGRKLPKGCTGSPKSTYTGKLVGLLDLQLPNGKKVKIRSMPASSQVGGGMIQCPESSDRRKGDGGDGDGGDGNDDEPRLILSGESDGTTFSFIATKRELSLTRSVAPKKERGATVSTVSSIRATGSNLLQPSDGGATAGVKSAGKFTGAGAYRSNVGPGPMTTGPLLGSLKVKLQGVPVITIAGENAMLMNGDK